VHLLKRIAQLEAELLHIKVEKNRIEKKVWERSAKLEESTKRQIEQAEKIVRLKDEFIFVAAHELRAPVGAIRGFLELVKEATDNFPKDVRENLEAISAASEHLNQLVDDLLEVARSESGTIRIEVEDVDIVTLINSIVKEFSPDIEKKHIKVNVRVAKSTPMVRGDTKKIKEVIVNLLSNAIKYNKEGGGVEIQVFTQEPYLITEIRDTGFGIPKQEHEKIFKKFFRVRARGTRDVMGTGLGLFITRMLVEKMGGKVMFTSRENEGTTFAFSLPL